MTSDSLTWTTSLRLWLFHHERLYSERPEELGTKAPVYRDVLATSLVTMTRHRFPVSVADIYSEAGVRD